MPEGLEEEELPEEGKGHVVMKERPSTFGDQNMVKPEFEAGTFEEGLAVPTERPEPAPVTPEWVPEKILTTTEVPPFEVRPGMFGESTPPTVAHREPSWSSEYAEQMTTFSPDTEKVQPVPDTFFVPKESCPTPNDPSDTNRTDVLFLLDSSNSFNEHKFMHAIQLILDTVSQFRNIGPNGTQVSLVQYNSEPYLEFSLRKHNCKQFLIDDIADTDYMQGGSMLGKAVEKVSRFAFTKNRVAKKHNLTVLVIATLEANPQYLIDLAEFPPLDTFEVKDGHGMITVALPTEEEEEQRQVQTMPEEEPEEEEEEREGFPAVTQTIVPIVPTISTPASVSTDAQGLVHLQCSPLGFKISLNVPPGYEGAVVVKGQEDKEECRKEIHGLESSSNLTVGFFVASKSCGVTRVHSMEPPGNNYTLILHVKHRVPLVTGGDRAYLLQCYIGKPSEDQELTADLGVMKGELMIAETISLLTVPPTCAYSIRKDSPNGTIVKTAFVGETVYHRWECDGGEGRFYDTQ
ncbi:von Willebrand factor type A domain protein [Teladorsagia circumcincta]|uniref:von Willebrand factor type A domain protein n=1 Tax=Teladorsagia circumcincta TaxID=45464 RepID=A0A2G9ULV6_TELCI|nr:von Willebrand factor type A domain protein [Teladorsagia circumcincta]